MSSWIYNGKILEDSEIPTGSVGFVYVITNLVTNRKYVGRKILTSTSRKPPKAGETRRKKVVKESSWRSYYGSSEEMKASVAEHGKEAFARHIVRFCSSKSSLAYFETKLIFETDALLRDDYINKWITCQINGRNLKDYFIEAK